MFLRNVFVFVLDYLHPDHWTDKSLETLVNNQKKTTLPKNPEKTTQQHRIKHNLNYKKCFLLPNLAKQKNEKDAFETTLNLYEEEK